MKTGIGQDAWKYEGWSRYQNSMEADSPKSERSCPESWTYRPNQVMLDQGRSTYESAPPLKGTPPYSCFEGDPTDKSRASPPVACWERTRKNPLHGRDIFHHRGAAQQPEQQDLCSNVPWGAFWRCRDAITLPTSWFGGTCPIRWVTPFHFCKKGVKLVSESIKRMCYKELWNSLTWPSSVVRNGSSSRTQFLPKSQDDSGVVAEERSGL